MSYTEFSGWRITGQNRSSRRNQRLHEVVGLLVENTDLLIVGIAVCWGGHDAYYINLRTVQEGEVLCMFHQISTSFA